MSSDTTKVATGERRGPQRLRFGLALALFLGWIGFLAYLVATSRQPVVLSRPQFLVSEVDVVAEVPGLEEPVEVVEVLGPEGATVRPGEKLNVLNLSGVSGWKGTGRYVLALSRLAEVGYVVTATPPSPGFSGRGAPRIYPETEAVRRQYATLSK